MARSLPQHTATPQRGGSTAEPFPAWGTVARASNAATPAATLRQATHRGAANYFDSRRNFKHIWLVQQLPLPYCASMKAKSFARSTARWLATGGGLAAAGYGT